MYSIRVLSRHHLRFILTITGVTGCIVLTLFLLSIYKGVADGSVEYIRKSDADLWVLQKNATNLLRGSSFLTLAHATVLRAVPSVESASPVLLILSSVKKEDERITVFLGGYDIEKSVGGPPE